MSHTLIDHNDDLSKLRDHGYGIQVSDSGFLLVHDIPYVMPNGKVARGILATPLDLAGDRTTQPKDHTIKFVGEYPCNSSGQFLEELRHDSNTKWPVGNGIEASHSFSRKPSRGHYLNYFEKITTYIDLIERHAVLIDSAVTSRTRFVYEPTSDNGVFNYIDTASARYDITASGDKLKEEVIGIVGLGGTGSYILDSVSKCPVKNIHLFDGGKFLTHNAFRAPGAASLEELREYQFKVNYFLKKYSLMHRKIEAHPANIDASNVELLRNLTFVFLCIDDAEAKKIIIHKLEEWKISFVDVGMGLYSKRTKIGGTLRAVLSTPANRDQARSRISFAKDNVMNDYDKNIQTNDLNSLNAIMAILLWKKYRTFYFDEAHEKLQCFSISNSLFVKDDISE